MKTSKPWYRFISKLLIFLMLIQGSPFWQISELYSWEYKPERAKRIIEFIGSAFSPSEASAAPPRVVCVPQLPTDLLVPHDTWSGEPTILKGIARDDDGDLSGGVYYWELGDGTTTAEQPISNADNLSVTHTYTAAPGTLFVARLHVTDAAGETSVDDYRVLVKAKTLDVEVNKAIDDGLWWLYLNKQASGSGYRWLYYSSYVANSTASAVQSFEINGHLETGDPNEDPYVDVVSGGIDYLMSRITSYNINIQTYGDPDTNGNGIGLSVNSSRQIYELGAVMDALVASGTPDAIARTGGSNVVGRRYQDIVQDMCDMYAWGQYDHASVGGGWRYSWNQWPDNSAAQWGAIGLVAAERLFDCVVPQWVKDRNNVWLDYSYNGTGFGYIGRGNGWATTPSGMIQLSFDGNETTDSRWQTAENWLAGNWNSFITNNSGRFYYSFYAFTKAMRLALPEEVTHFSNGFDWYGDSNNGMARNLVNRQNSNGSWSSGPYSSTSMATAWSIIILTRTLFEKPPVALIDAEPNPGAIGQQILLDASGSYHVDPAKTIVEYLWDFDASDGVDFDNPDATGITAEVTYGALGTYSVSLKVIDDSTPSRFDVGTLDLAITIPPHPPTAVIGGPYIATVGEGIQLDGSGSYDVDEPEGDSITAWAWEADFIAPYDFDEAMGETVTIPGFNSAGHYDIALQVTDNTAVIFPTSGSPNLTHVTFGQVSVFNSIISDLAARPKATKCQLTWTDVGAAPYEVLRSSAGPNHGFELIGSTDSTYSTFLDYNVEMYTDYWYRIRCEHNGETMLSGPVHVNSQGRIRNLPPTITSSPVVDAQEGQVFNYDVEADDPEGTALTFYLDQAPDGMTIDAAGGLITWTPAFADVGLADVTVRVEDAGRASASQFFQITVQPRPNTAPIPDHGGPYEGLINTAVSFDAGGTSDPEGDPIASFHWNFGDGTEGYGATVEHTYTAPATYTVTLYVTDDRGATASAETVCQVEAPNRMPEAVIAGPNTGEAGVPMAFNALDSSDPDGDPLTYTWNFGDSTPAETGDTVLHTYGTAGTYTVSLSADDGRGGLDTAELEVVVSEPNQPPEAAFTVSGDLIRLATVTFDGSASSDPEGEPIASYEWDFGDGTSTTGQVVTHMFDSAASFTVTLTVTDDKGFKGTTSQTIDIAEIMVTVPDVVGQNQADAEAAIIGADLTVGTITTQYSISTPEGQVISQTPSADTSAAMGSAVDLVVSLGPEPVTVPSVVGMVQTDAEAAIINANLVVGSVTTQYSDTVPENQVISQTPVAGTSSFSGSSVDLVISLGVQPVTVPSVVGMVQAEAENTITSANLVVGTVTTEYNATVPAGSVISQLPASGASVMPGSAVNLIVSLGPEPDVVPDVVGLGQSVAQTAITNAGFSVGTVSSQYDDNVSAGLVISQTPAAGTSAVPGTSIDILVSLGSQPVIVPNVVGLSQAEAEAAIVNAGLVVGTVSDQYSDNVPAGNVISSTPSAGATVSSGSSVAIVVSLGPSPVVDYLRPEVNLTVTPTIANVGETVTLTVTASDNEAIATTSLFVNGVQLSLDAANSASYSSPDAGVFTAVAVATDSSGNQGQDSEVIRFITTGDTTPPTVSISTPDDEAEISVPTDLIGTASDDSQLVYYELAYAKKDSGKYVTFASSDTSVTNDVLGQLDPTTMRNGLYDVRLTAEDASGNTASITRTYQIDGDMKVGNFTISFNDLTIPMAGIPITITRTYDSRIKSKGDFGVGWVMDLKAVEVQENRVPGEGWQTYCTQSIFGTCLAWGVQPVESHSVLVTFPDGRDHEFDVEAVATYADQSGLAQGTLQYSAQSGTFGSLQALESSTFDFLMDGELLDFGFNVINPDRYRLTDVDGTVFDFNQNTGLEQITDANGNTIQFTSNGIIHSAGKSVTFTRDSEGRIISITDPMGNSIDFAYDFYGDLISVTDQEGNVTQFTYNSTHGLVDIIDPRGIRPARNEYDGDGNLVAIIDADGNRVEFAHNVGTRQEVVTDRMGNLTVYDYDDEGHVVSQTDALGNTTTYTYNANGNKLSETDPLGNTTSYTYDARDNMLTQTDPLGNTTTYTYNSQNQVLTTTDSMGNVTSNNYDAKGNLLTTIDSLGNVTTNTHDAKGNLLTTTDPLGNVTSHTYDSYGNMSSQTDPLGNTTTYTYDAKGNQVTQTVTRTIGSTIESLTTTRVYDGKDRVIETTDVLGNSTFAEYNSIGKQSATTDKNGNITFYEYDARGNLTATIYPDGTTETATYDVNGNKLSFTDRAGRTTSYIYDALNRLITTTFPDGASINSTYDAVGRVISTTDERGNSTSYSYDAAGKRTWTSDALGNVTSFTYDANGNQLTSTDANGNTTTYEYDTGNRRVRTIFADGTATVTGYDALGRKISETDQAGITTVFSYDALGRLTSVTDALGQVTSYTYDEVGNKITQTDANGNTTTWTYDALGRVTSRILPMGMSEVFTYDAQGNMLTKIDFNGETITFAYDVNNRLITKTLPDSSTITFSYTATGQRSTVTDTRGFTAYTYDLRDRVLEVQNPGGATIEYRYDASGNRISLTIPSGTTTYTFDALNRPQKVTDPDSGITTYGYDNVGNRANVAYPNGSVTSYTYDSLNRLTYLENTRSDLTLISSYTYTLGSSGNRLQVVENTGRIVDYTYDALYRLIEEDITDPTLGNETISYTYDSVGNRLSKTDSNGTINYTYDANDRLLSESGDTYTYDDNGNTISKTDGVNTTTYDYDYENRLVSVDTPGSLIDYEYDADGIRVSSAVDGLSTNYLVDKNRNYAQVMEERDGTGALIVSYIYGDDLISQNRSSLTSYFIYDGLMSTRQLTDSTEATTDTYVFDAFGNELHRNGTTMNNYLYTGEQYDPNIGFYYLRARYYSQNLGRFLNFDVFEGENLDPKTLHKYLYTGADPINNIDPTGYFTISQVMVSVAIVSILSSLAIGIYSSKISGGTFSPDAAIYGISMSVTGSALAGGAALSTFIFSKMPGLTGGLFFRYSIIASVLSQKAMAGVQLGQGIGLGITFGAELCATATDKKLGYFAFGGPLGAVGKGAVGWGITFYSGVVWNVPSIEDYRSYPIPMFAVGLTAGIGGWFGFTQTYFSNPSFSQYGQVTGITIGNGITPALSGGPTWSQGPDIVGSGLSAVEPYLVFAWPPPQNVLLNLKAHGL